MNTIFYSRFGLLAFFLVALAACSLHAGGPEWRDLGKLPAPAGTQLNHTPMIMGDDTVLVGTNDGIWSRTISRSDDWERLGIGLEGVRIFAVRRHPTIETTLFAAGQPLTDVNAAPFYRSEDSGATWVPSTAWPLNPLDDSTETFFDFVIAPDDPNRLYANLSGQSVAISTDGGATWTLADGATAVLTGESCVLHILPAQPGKLYQGCEEPLDRAWLGTYDINADDPFQLDNFTFVAGGPDSALGNRRPNSLTSGPAKPSTLYAGLEGQLIALEGAEFESVFEVAADGSDDLPYTFIKGIWLDPSDGGHLIFGGGIDGVNSELALFETDDHGRNIEQLPKPEQALSDPAVEQILPIKNDDLAVLISESDGTANAERTLRVFVLDPNGSPFN